MPARRSLAARASPAVLVLPGLEKTEGMADRIRVDAPTALVDVQQRRAQVQNPRVSLIEVEDVDVKVELLRVHAVWPLGRPKVCYALKPEHETGLGVQGREIIADSPPGIGLVDRAAEQRLVEPGQTEDVRAVQNQALQRAEHAVLAFPDPGCPVEERVHRVSRPG